VFTAFGLAAEAEPLPGGLYVVATPIGNLKDITLRALNVLAAADAVLAEDTRVTKTLLAHYGITSPLVAYHEHSGEVVRERLLHRLNEGQALALVSDAGNAARLRPRLPARRRRDRGRRAGHPHPRPLGGADRAGGLGPAD
jgi:16S rRNA (cytidine1402-2'-O)-methyltransferase